MEEIGSKWDTLTREQQVYLTQTMAGQRQYSRLMALFDNFDKYEAALKTAQDAEGTLQTQQETRMDALDAHLKQLKAAIEDIFMSLTDTDSITGIVDGLTDVAELIDNIVDSLGGGIGIVKMLGSLALTLFSKQIGTGLNTFLNNIELAKQKTQDMQSFLTSME